MKTILPSRALSRHIEHFWYAHRTPFKKNLISEYYPDGNTDLIFEFSNTRCRLFLFGPAAGRAYIKTRLDRDYLSIRFRPGKFPVHKDLEPSLLVDRFIEVPAVFGWNADCLADRLLSAPDMAARTAIIEAILGNFRLPEKNGDCPCQQAIERIERSGGHDDIGSIAADLGISLRQLERRLRQTVGLSPKVFSRTVRLQRILATLSNTAPGRLTDMAYRYGYTDQAHFVRDIKSLTGRTPGFFLRTRRNDPHVTYLPEHETGEKRQRIYHQL